MKLDDFLLVLSDFIPGIFVVVILFVMNKMVSKG